MPVNRNALIRYRTIDKCLGNRYRKWTLDNLVEACSEALYEYEGIDKGVSLRTVQLDIQLTRSDKLGYNAPIIVTDRKFYTYEDPNYSISNISLTEQDLGKLTEVIGILKQFKGFTHFQELSGMLQKLEDKVHTEKTKEESIIQFETNEDLKGTDFIDTFYQSILQKKALSVTYQSFKARNAETFHFHAQLLKEFRNRWFVLGFKRSKQVPLLLALDRIIEASPADITYVENTHLDLKTYFRDVVGVSVNLGAPTEEVELFVEHSHAPYLLTKPLHASQKIKEHLPGGIILSLEVQLNFELEKELLGLGEQIKVLKPDSLLRRMKQRTAALHQIYTGDLHPTLACETIKKVSKKGSAILNSIYTAREIRQIIQLIESQTSSSENFRKTEDLFAIRKLFVEIPELKKLIFNQKLCTLVKEGMGQDFFISKAIYFDKPPLSNWYVTWHQDLPINVKEKIETEGYSGWTKKKEIISVIPPLDVLKNIFTVRIHLDNTTAENGALQVIQKSHLSVHSDAEIQQLRKLKESTICEVEAGGIHLMKPLTLHASGKTMNNEQRRVIHLEFASAELANSLEWAERDNFK